jgi:hypothetical protein
VAPQELFQIELMIGCYVPYAGQLQGYAVAQLVEALFYKPEGREFYSRWGNWVSEISTRDLLLGGGGERPVLRADNLTTFMCRLFRNYGTFKRIVPYGPIQACNGIAVPFLCR